MASATDVNGTIDDASLQAVDHQCSIDEINNSVPEIVQKDADTNIDSSVVNVVDDNINSTIDKNIDSTVTLENSSVEPSNQKQATSNIIEVTPKVINLDVKKQDSLKKDIAKYSEFFLIIFFFDIYFFTFFQFSSFCKPKNFKTFIYYFSYISITYVIVLFP